MTTQRGRGDPGRSKSPGGARPMTLKALAEHLGLSPTTISVVLNRSPVADAIPQETKDRVYAAAQELNYRPNHLARSLRSQRSFSIGILVPEVSEGYAAQVISGIERQLVQEGYFYLVAGHRSSQAPLDEHLQLFKQRSVEGLVLVNTPVEQEPELPTVTVSGHQRLAGVTNVVIDHDRAAVLALSHLQKLGHGRIAFFKGHPGSADTEERWRAIAEAAAGLGLEIDEELTLQLSGEPAGEVFTPEEGYLEGYAFGRKLLTREVPFTALFAFNDISAIGAMRAFFDAGRRVPQDISIVGFDDIQSAAFQNPSLTTVRQPLTEMGATAARALLAKIANRGEAEDFITIEPELMIRDSTGPVEPSRR